jgi:RecB family exonuclease
VSTLSYSALTAYGRCGYRFYCEQVLGLPEGSVHSTAGDGLSTGRSALDRGVLLHALLQRVSFRRPVAPSADLIAAVAAGTGLARPSGDEASELAETVGRFCDSELCRRLAAANVVRREEQFAFELSGSTLVTGAVDVLARERGGRMLIVDYKSDRLDGAEPAQLVAGPYATQRLVYALAGLRAGALYVEVAHCFLERPEQPVVASLHRSAIGELEQQLLALAHGVLREEFAVSRHPHRALCAGCPAEGGLCSWPIEMTRRESADRLF